MERKSSKNEPKVAEIRSVPADDAESRLSRALGLIIKAASTQRRGSEEAEAETVPVDRAVQTPTEEDV